MAVQIPMRRSLLPLLFLLSCLLLLAPKVVASADDESSTSTTATSTKSESTTTFSAKDHLDWGSYHDPRNIFCGKYDCYRILGLDYESFGSQPPDRKVITQRYRALSREWHPDKSRHRDAKQRFVHIARAYEVLTNEEQRQEYDAMRYDPELYFDKYGASVLWSYAPKSDAVFVVVGLLLAATGVSWVLQRQKWQQVANRLIRAAVEDWGPREGGTPESRELREKAMALLEERRKRQEEKNETAAKDSANGTQPSSSSQSSSTKRKKTKLTGSEKRKQLEEALRPIVTELVDEMHDFGAGYHKPTWRDLLILRAIKFPVYLYHGISWNLRYFVRRLQNKELNEEERQVLTVRAIGDIAWASASEEEQKEWIHRDLWVTANMADWEEEQGVKFLSASEQKRYARMKKKGKKWDSGNFDKED